MSNFIPDENTGELTEQYLYRIEIAFVKKDGKFIIRYHPNQNKNTPFDEIPEQILINNQIFSYKSFRQETENIVFVTYISDTYGKIK